MAFSPEVLTYDDLRREADEFLGDYHKSLSIPTPIEEIVEFEGIVRELEVDDDFEDREDDDGANEGASESGGRDFDLEAASVEIDLRYKMFGSFGDFVVGFSFCELFFERHVERIRFSDAEFAFGAIVYRSVYEFR